MSKSGDLFAEAKKYIPGGVNSPVRAFKAVGGNPLFIERGAGSKIHDADGNEYIDFVGSWGPLILGHAHPEILAALAAAMKSGTSFGAPTELEVQLAKAIIKAVPSMEMVRLVSSGTEAAMSAIRLARGYTGRDRILKFDGCYHGHSDALLVKAGSGAATLGVPDSPGVTAGLAKDTITLSYNDLDGVKDLFSREGETIACVIIEPIAGNMGVVQPKEGFLQGLRDLTNKFGALLIFDEVITGFRVAYGGAQELYGIKPDLTCLGKIIGGGLPVGAFGGKREIMEKMAPVGPVYQAGTLSGNPLAVAAGLKMLEILGRPGFYDDLEKKTKRLTDGFAANVKKAGIPVFMARVGSMFCSFFTGGEVVDFATAAKSDTARFGRYFSEMLRNGIYIAPSQFEAGFVSSAHDDADLDKTIEAHEKALAAL
ncbi:MAG: glutamate-1-semialdehyde 2,1-aminomutase [Nitrospinae bacterium]|nr:glutamate-1-semialdehyde 2,1-aminomutase [Nitrospinota bacterium]